MPLADAGVFAVFRFRLVRATTIELEELSEPRFGGPGDGLFGLP